MIICALGQSHSYKRLVPQSAKQQRTLHTHLLSIHAHTTDLAVVCSPQHRCGVTEHVWREDTPHVTDISKRKSLMHSESASRDTSGMPYFDSIDTDSEGKSHVTALGSKVSDRKGRYMYTILAKSLA